MRWLTATLFLLLLTPCFAYTLVPHQTPALVRMWTDAGDASAYLEQPTQFTTDSPLRFIALDSDNDGVFDRGGVPDANGTVALYPVGVVHGVADKQTTLSVSCSYPCIKEYTLQGPFSLVLPAGACSIAAQQGNKEATDTLTVTANDVTQLKLHFELALWLRILITIGIAALALLLALNFMRVNPFRKKKGPSRQVTAVLKPEERQVIEYLCTRGPQLAGVVRKDLAMSKTSFHRLLQRLRERNLVLEEEYGNTTRIRWNETFHRK